MADLTIPPPPDALTAQVAAREAASREDAAVLAPLRSEAAARALGLLDRASSVRPPASGGEASVATTASTPSDAPPPPPEPMVAAALDVAPPATATEPVARPAVVVPSGGPARVTTGVLAAAAAQRPRPEPAVMELRPTVLATDIDRIGDQLVVMKDRLELRDRHGGLRRTVALSDIDDVEIHRRLTSAVLVVSTRTSTDLVMKGLRPDAAEAAREAVLRLRPVVAPASGPFDERVLMRAIVELHRVGVLDDDELAAKTAIVARMAGRTPG